MYSCECLTKNVTETQIETQIYYEDSCRPFWGMCYPEAEGCCGPDCNPN